MAPPQNGAASEVLSFVDPEPPTEQVSHLMDEAGYDLSRSGLRYLSNEARVRLLDLQCIYTIRPQLAYSGLRSYYDCCCS